MKLTNEEIKKTKAGDVGELIRKKLCTARTPADFGKLIEVILMFELNQTSKNYLAIISNELKKGNFKTQFIDF